MASFDPFSSAHELRGLNAKKKISPVEVVDEYLRRTDKLNPALNAVTWRRDEAVRKGRRRGSSGGRHAAGRHRGEELRSRGPLRDEIASFLDAITTGRRPVVSGEDGLRALETAIRIGELLGRPAAPPT